MIGNKNIVSFNYWLANSNLIFGLFRYEAEDNYDFLDQIRFLMKEYHQQYSEILRIPTEERLEIIKKGQQELKEASNEL